MNGAEILAKMLSLYEVRYIFGLPGDTNTALYAALSAHSSITHVLTRDERGAGCMADAYARVSGRPGVVEVPSGGGPLYALPSVAEAHLSQIPVVIITSDTPLGSEGRGFITAVDCVRVFEPVTKASIQVKSAHLIPEIVRRAFRIATSGCPGAVHIAVPEDIYHQEVDARTISFHVERECTRFPAFPAKARSGDVEALAALVGQAARPLLVAGGGVNRSGAAPALASIARRCSIPVVTTITGQNVMPDSDELAIGVIGDNGFHPHALRALEEADLVIYVGCRLGSTMTIGWSFPSPRADRKCVQIDIDPEVLGNGAEYALGIVGDAREVLEAFNQLPLPVPARRDPQWIATLNSWRRRFWDVTRAELETLAADAALTPLPPQLVIDALARRLVEPHYVISDPGTPTPYLCRLLRLDDGRSRLIFQRALGALGYAIPAVVGAWHADPSLRPIGLFGDGSLGMSVGELETISRLGIPAILVNFNNSSFGYIAALQRSQKHPRGMSVDFSPQDCAALARAYGIHAIRVERFRDLEAALDEAFAHSGPIFLDVVVRSVAEETPPMYTWLRRHGIDPLQVGGQNLVMERA
jgi:acetolactate synthase-1/2/3 large subunit